jgi:GT2 family glycosyltransferase/Flp pilus assembly protein TadD
MSRELLKKAQSLLQANHVQEARQLLVTILGDDTASTDALITLAQADIREAKYDSALELLQEVLGIDPKNPDALRERELVRAKISMHDKGRITPVTAHATVAATNPEPIQPHPKISIIIPVYNQVAYTKQCIEAVRATCINHDYEIIVIDDCSTDGTEAYLASLEPGVRSFRNEKNQGFILNCNFGASQARGEYIVLLNNDTIPQENWLAGLLEPFELYENVAATGALMIFPNNTVLEASSIIFSDGSGWNYGRGNDPESSRYSFIREADYIPGGGMMIRKNVWDELGGLDTYYAPAYYDDIDFCFRARKAGYKILYTPFSRIIHFEGMSGGTDVTKGVKRYQVINQEKFRERWKDELTKNHYENKYENVFRASRREKGKRVLLIDHMLPLPNFNSGCFRMNHMVKQFIKLGHKITFAHLSNSDPENYKDDLRKIGVETVALNYEAWQLAGSQKKAALIDQVLNSLEVYRDNYDIVYLAFHWVAALFIKELRRRLPKAIIFVDSIDIHFLRKRREAELSNDRKQIAMAEHVKREELAAYARADAVITVTEDDRQVLLKELPYKPSFVMPNVHDIVPTDVGFNERKDLLFVGGFNHAPNVDCMLYFCHEIFPRVQKAIPGIKLWIVGSNPTNEVKALADESVIVTGWVKDTKPYLDQSRISVVPLRYGAGMKGKVGEALSHGLPVITTPVGSEGMGIINGDHAIVVESVDEWIDHIKRLYHNEALWNRLSKNGQDLISSQYGSDKIRERARHMFSFQSREDLAAQSPCPSKNTFTYANGITSIVILTYNQLDYTKECIKSIQQHTPEPHEIIFIDNASTDGTVKWLRKIVRDNRNYSLIENPRNFGFAKGCNQGIEASLGEYILLLNNDVVVTKDWLTGMLECLKSAQDMGIAGPMTNSISGPQKVPAVGYTAIGGLEEYARAFRQQNRNRRIPHRRVVGFCMLFRHDLADDIGPLDENFGTGNFEDDDYCLRAELLGYQNVIAGDVFVHHYGSRSFVGNKINYRSVLSKNRRLFTNKWSGIDAETPLGRALEIVNARDKALELNHQDNLEKAVETMLDGIRKAPEAKSLYYTLAEMLIDAKQFSEAFKILTALLPNDEDPRRLSLAASCEEGLGHDEAAENVAQRALARNPASAHTLNLLGVLAYKQEDRGAAREFFKKAAASDPGYGEPWTNLGIMKWAEGGKKEALDLLERGFILSPTAADSIIAYQAAAADTGELTRLERILHEARALYPLHKSTLFFLIDALVKQENYAKAMEEVEEAMLLHGIDDTLLATALGIRDKIGPQKIDAVSGNKATLSLCMIVKNEEHHLPKCLTSIKSFANEIIIVDTGSTDRTKDIARAFGASVYDVSWTGDFAEARNTSLAKATGDWVLVLDADEVISPLDHPALARLLNKRDGKKTAYSLLTRNYVVPTDVTGWTGNDGTYAAEEAGTGWIGSLKVRLFPRDSSIRFVNPVHELVEPSLKKIGISVKESGISIHHYGKLDREKGIAKGKEYYQLGRKKLDEMGESVDALQELAVQAGELNRFDEALELWDRVLQIKPDLALAYVNRGSIYLQLDRYPEAQHEMTRAVELAPQMKDAVYSYALCELYAGNADRTISALRGLIRREPNYPPAGVLLAVTYCCCGKKELGIELFKSLGGNREGLIDAICRAAGKLLSAGRTEYAASLLDAAREGGFVNDELLRLMEHYESPSASR